MAGGGAGGNDFFLQFGSDAEPFSRQLAADLDPGIAKINALREALLAYDETAGKIKGGSSPLGITFDGLDQAASRLEAASKSFSGQMEAQVNALGDKITLLSETLSTVLRNVRAVPPGGGSRPGVGGPPREEGGRNTRRLTELDPQTQARLNALERAKRTGNNVGTVTPAEKAAADKTRLVNQESADSANKAADANSLNAKQVKATARALESLTGKLQTLIDTAKQMPKAGGKSASPAAASADAALQIANTTANPVPVIVVGGEAQAAVGHPPAHQTHMPHATTATSTAKAQAEVAAAAELVNAPNSFKNPARVLPGDRVAAGQYFLLPGQEKPTRAFGIRKGETVGEYSARVDAMRARELAALAGGPKLSEEDQQTLSRWREANGPLPKPRIRVEPISSPLTGSSRTHSTVSMDTVSAAEPYPKEISNLLRRRDLFASERQSLAHGYALSELRLDPMMTQDGLSGETKSALSQIDQAILAMNTKRRLEMLFEGEDHPDLETLKKGAKNRQKLREEGRAAAEEGRLTANAEAAIVGKAGTRDPITGEWYYGEGMVGVNERRDTQFASNMQLGRVAEERRDRVESGAERENDIANAGAHYRNAQAMAERLAAVRPTDIANVFEDQSGERVSLSKLRDQLSAFIAPYIQGELTPGIRRAQQGVRRNNPSSIERYEQQLRELTAQRALLTVSPKGSVEDQLASLRQVAQNYANLRGAGLTESVVETERPASSTSAILTPAEERKLDAVDRYEATKQRRSARSKSEQPEEVGEHDWAAYESSDIGMRQKWWDEDAAALNSGTPSRRGRRAAGGGGGKPPRRPPAPPASSEPEPEEPEARKPLPTPKPPTRQQLRQNVPIPDLVIDPQTRQAIISAKAVLARGNVSNEARLSAVGRAASAFYNDPNYRSNGTPPQRVRALTQALGLDVKDSTTRNLVQRGLQDAQTAAKATADQQRSTGAAQAAQGESGVAAASERSARMEDILATSSGKVREARLAEFIADENLQRLRASESATIEQIARAYMQLSAAQRNSLAVQQQDAIEQNKSRYAQLTGRRAGTTFGGDLLRHGSYALENTIGYSLVFTGFEKLREVVQTGIEAQAVFVRLQASLDANGIAAGNLRSQLSSISATTATPLEQVTEAAAELSGTLTNAADIGFGTKIASQLANISQGALTAQEAAVGLRDVIAAFGDEWASAGLTVQQGLQQTGDQIAHLSQLTGVSVKDITEGTTQIAQEAHEFGLSQRQASTLAAYITKGTGESGEESAAQASRMLATLYNGKSQQVLETTRLYGKNGQMLLNPDGSPQTLATQAQFEQGKIGDVLQNIAANWDKLTPRERQAISAQMGTGIQARAFSAFVGGGKAAAAELGGTADDTGALNRQNQAYLATVAGMIKQLDEDFQNLGSTLQRLGAFDAIGILAKSMDELLKTFNKVFGSIASVMESNPITAGLMKWSTVILEAAAAWKLFGGAATRALVNAGVLKNITPTNQAAIAEARAANAAGIATPIPAAQYGRARFSTVAGAIGSRLYGMSGRYADRYYNPTLADQPLARSNPLNLLSAGRIPAIGSAAWNGLKGLPGTIRGLPNTLSNFNGRQFANQQYMNLRYGRVVAPGFASDIRSSEVRAALREQASVVNQARLSGQLAPGAQVTPITKGEEEAARSMKSLGLSAQSAAVLIRTSAEEQSVAMTSLSLRMRTFAGSLVASIGAFAAQMALFAAVGYAISEFSKTTNEANQRNSAANAILSGSTSKKDLATVQSTQSFANWYFGNSTSISGKLGNAAKHTGEGIVNFVANPLSAFGIGPSLFGSGQSGPSAKSNQLELDLVNSIYGTGHMTKVAQARIKGEGLSGGPGAAKLPNLGSVDAVAQWQKAEQEYIDKHAKDIEKAGGNNKNSQAQIAGEINQLKANLQTAAQNRIATLEGLNQIDQLNANQLANLSTMAGTLSSLSGNTLATQGGALLTLLQQTGLPTGSGAYANLKAAMGGGVPLNTLGVNSKGQIGSYSADGTWHPATKAQTAGIGPTEGSHLAQLGNGPSSTDQIRRLQALQGAYQSVIQNAKAKIDAGGLSAADLTTYTNDLTQGLTGYQQITQQLQQAQITAPQSRGSMLAALGGTPQVAAQMGLGGGGDQAAVASLTQANAALTKYNSTLETTDPQYWQNLQQIQQNKLQIAQLQNQPALNALLLAAASTTDATTQANLKYKQAVLQLKTDQAGGASLQQIGADKAGIAAAGVAQSQAQEAVAAATAQASIAGVRNDVTRAQMSLNEALRQEAVYAQGGSLADKANYEQAVAQEKQQRLAIKDAIEQQTQSAYDATSALQKLHGNDLAAAQTSLAKAKQSYAYAVSQYGAQSQQAEQALAQIYQTESDLIQAQLAQVNSFLDLDIARLNARGKQGDAQRAAQDAIKKIQNQISSYLSHGGQKGTATYNDLIAQMATAQRTAFDTALQAQLDTLDFQKETYQITSSQEVQALQQILKNKQLTLKEQRDITLKIKDLQNSIRQELTQGGLNIPSNINLPTAYEVRRSLGAGFGGAGTSISTVNNNQQVTVNNNVPNAQVAAQIANQVIQLINRQTGQAIRSNSSTPRIVSTK